MRKRFRTSVWRHFMSSTRKATERRQTYNLSATAVTAATAAVAATPTVVAAAMAAEDVTMVAAATVAMAATVAAASTSGGAAAVAAVAAGAAIGAGVPAGWSGAGEIAKQPWARLGRVLYYSATCSSESRTDVRAKRREFRKSEPRSVALEVRHGKGKGVHSRKNVGARVLTRTRSQKTTLHSVLAAKTSCVSRQISAFMFSHPMSFVSIPRTGSSFFTANSIALSRRQ